jgi:hypothetical protein
VKLAVSTTIILSSSTDARTWVFEADTRESNPFDKTEKRGYIVDKDTKIMP